jgi:hypothetical protein
VIVRTFSAAASNGLRETGQSKLAGGPGMVALSFLDSNAGLAQFSNARQKIVGTYPVFKHPFIE